MKNNIIATQFVTAYMIWLNACIPIPYKVHKPIEEEDVEEIARLENREIPEHLGPPKETYLIGSKEYLIYEYPPQTGTFPLTHPVGYVVFGGLILFMNMITDYESTYEEPDESENEWSSACMMITLDHKNNASAEV